MYGVHPAFDGFEEGLVLVGRLVDFGEGGGGLVVAARKAVPVFI